MTDRVLITRGDRGTAVRDMKARLHTLGFPAASGEAFDEFGPGTEATLRAFQAARGLRVDGVCGPQTWSAIVEAGYALGDRLLYHRQPMVRGDDVAALQRSLGALGFDAGKEDGIFGARTAEALREFQRNTGLTVDGICGPETLTAMHRVSRDAKGSVAQVKEREAVLHETGVLRGRRAFVAVEPGLETLAEEIRHGLVEAGADVVVESTIDDQSKLAVEANAWDADLVLMFRVGEGPERRCAFYARGDFRSARGQRLAECLNDELTALFGGAFGLPQGKTYALLRETRAPAVVCEIVPGDDPSAVSALRARTPVVGRAVVGGIRRAVEERPPASSSDA